MPPPTAGRHAALANFVEVNLAEEVNVLVRSFRALVKDYTVKVYELC